MKTDTTKKIIISCAVVVLITCMCLSLIVVGGALVSVLWPIDFDKIDASTFTDTFKPLTGTESLGETVLPENVAVEMQEIEVNVSQLRGLALVDEVPKVLLSPEMLQEIVVNEFFAEYSDEDARQDALILSLLGLIPEDFELRSFYHALYTEQIAGFYDRETKEIYLVSGVAFNGFEKMTYAHEFTHVLQDQTYGLDDGLGITEEACDEDSERCAAIQALIEGDASLTEYLWFTNHATRKDQKDVFRMSNNYDSQVFDDAPPFFQQDLLFPYDQGLAFVEFLYAQDGFSEIDAAYRNPPVSTEQILHPERYPWDVPQLVSLPNLETVLGDDWSLLVKNVMGEWSTYLILSQPYEADYRLSNSQASDAAEGWGGDAYAFYLNEVNDEILFILDMVWDSVQDADEFMTAVAHYANLRWEEAPQDVGGHPTWIGLEGIIVFFQEGERTLWMIAPDETLAETVFEVLK